MVALFSHGSAALLQAMESVLLFKKHKDKLVAIGEVICSDFCRTREDMTTRKLCEAAGNSL